MKKLLQSISKSESIVVIGLGNPDRADDGLGIMLSEKLQREYPERVFSERQRSVEGIVIELLENKAIDTFIFVDATDFGGDPGEIRLFSAEDSERFMPAFSTHKVPISLLMDLIVQHGKKSVLLGVQPGSVELLGEMSQDVIQTMKALEKELSDYLQSIIEKL
jgi:hydrogenase maturation protease